MTIVSVLDQHSDLDLVSCATDGDDRNRGSYLGSYFIFYL